MKRSCVILVIGLVAAQIFAQQESRADTALAITAFPNVILPLPTDPRYFNTGGGAEIAVDVPLPLLPFLGLRAGLGYAYLPIWTGDSTNLVTGVGGITIAAPTIAGRITTELLANAGYYYGIIADEHGESGGNGYFTGGLRLGWRLAPSVDQGLEVRYEAALDGLGGLLYHGLSLGLSTRFIFLRRRELQIENIELLNLFPVLYKRYTNHGFGKATIRNASAKPVENLRVTFYVDKYMDTPWDCPAPTRLEGGQSTEVDIVALFSETNVLDITESTVVSGRITATYTQDEREFSVNKAASLRIQDRHAITWDDDRKAAAYVTYKDPVIVDIATSISRVAGQRADVADPNFRTAIALHEALSAYGIDYRIDPTTPFIELSKTTDVIDYLQFPRNTLERRAGDCDDLSILYAAVLQAVGIDTAFITIPGHIYMAFALKAGPEDARTLFSDPNDLIVYEDRAWIPIEVTMVGSSFLEAWKTGATEWQSGSASGTALIYPLSQAWREYEPVGQVGEYDAKHFVSSERVFRAFTEELDRFIAREIYVQADELEKQLSTGQSTAEALNRLGVVYARYGQLKKARGYFERALAKERRPSAIINLGNVSFREGDLAKARTLYEEALTLSPDNPILLLQLARVHNLLGNFEASASYYEELKVLDPKLAKRHSYLDLKAAAAERSASRETSGEVLSWLDE